MACLAVVSGKGTQMHIGRKIWNSGTWRKMRSIMLYFTDRNEVLKNG